MSVCWFALAAFAQEPVPAAPPAPVETSPPPVPPSPDPAALARFQEERLVREVPVSVDDYQPDWIVRYPTSAPMDTALFLQTVGSLEHQRELKQLQDRELQTGVGLALGGTMLELIGVGMLSYGLSTEESALAGSGGLVMLGGLGIYYACAFPFQRHSRREKHPALLLSPQEADRLIETYNQELRTELGLP